MILSTTLYVQGLLGQFQEKSSRCRQDNFFAMCPDTDKILLTIHLPELEVLAWMRYKTV